MISLLTLITDTIRAVAPHAYLEEAPKDATYPYVVYRLPTSTEEEHREDFILEVSLWDRGLDTTAVEGLTANVDAALNRMKHLAPALDMQVSVYRINRLMIPDPDPMIRRRELRYQLKAYFV